MLLIAHRSGPVKYPEQTVASAKHAVSLGADMVEIDVRFTADGQLAVTHDENLSRIFGVDKTVGEVTAAEFVTLRHKEHPQFGAHMLKDYMETGLPLLIHVKEEKVLDTLLGEIAADKGRIVLGVSTPEAVRRIRSFDPGIRILSFSQKQDVAAMLAVGVDCFRLWETWLTPELVSAVKESSADLWVMSGDYENDTVGEPTEAGLKTIFSFAPDGILINDITKCL